MRWLIQRLILGIIANAVALFAVQYLLSGMGFLVAPEWGYLVVGAFIGIMNTLIKPLLSLLTLPLVFLTMGLFLIVINGILLFVTEYIFTHIIPSLGVTFTVGDGWIVYLVAAVLLSIINSITHFFLTKS